MGTHFGKSRDHLLFEWLTLFLEIVEGKLVKTVLREVIACEDIEELISHPRLAFQFLDVETVEMAHAQGSLDLFFDVVDYPWRRTRDNFFFVDFETGYFQCFCLGRIVIDLFFGETVDVGIVDSDHESVLRQGQKVDPHF